MAGVTTAYDDIFISVGVITGIVPEHGSLRSANVASVLVLVM
jgi:hypothetical protein